MKPGDSFGEARRARLQDVRRLDLEDAVVADGRDAIPARTILNRRLLHLLSAPRREDHLGIAPRDFRRIDDAILREAAARQLREDRRATGDLDELFDPPDPRDQRLVPFLEK